MGVRIDNLCNKQNKNNKKKLQLNEIFKNRSPQVAVLRVKSRLEDISKVRDVWGGGVNEGYCNAEYTEGTIYK